MERALEWISYATRKPVEDIVQLGLDDHQVQKLGAWLEHNRLLNPPVGEVKKKLVMVACKCGCGERFLAEYTTKRPQFKNEAHRIRYWRAKAKENEG